MYLADVKKANHLNLGKLWADDGMVLDLFVATMSAIVTKQWSKPSGLTKRVQCLSKQLKTTYHRLGMFLRNYKIGVLITLDEMLRVI